MYDEDEDVQSAPTSSVKVTIPAVTIEIPTVEMVTHELIRQLLDEEGPYNKQLRLGIKAATLEAVKPAIQEEVGKLVSSTLGEVLPQTNQFGEKTGTPKTLRELILEQGSVFLSEKVNTRGERAYDGQPRYRWMIAQEVEKAMNIELRGVLAEAIAEIKTTVKGRFTSEVTERLFGRG